jgi:hypothetical protein
MIAEASIIQVYVVNSKGVDHVFTLSMSEITTILRGVLVGELIFYWAVSMTKLSILLYYRRICSALRIQSVMRKMTIIINALIAITIGYIVSFTIITLSQCR